MTREQAQKVRVGDTVTFLGVRCRVISIRVRPEPAFRLAPLEQCSQRLEREIGGLTSCQICGLPK